jgi:hypothetical protein
LGVGVQVGIGVRVGADVGRVVGAGVSMKLQASVAETTVTMVKMRDQYMPFTWFFALISGSFRYHFCLCGLKNYSMND